MTMTPSEAPPLGYDRKLLKRVKLTLWAVTLVFFIHGVLAIFPEVYPITRWAMFSDADRPPKALFVGPTERLEAHVTHGDGEVTIVPFEQLYDSIPLGSARGYISFWILSHAAGNSTTTPEMQRQARKALFDRLEIIFGISITRVEIWYMQFPVDYTTYPYVDYSQPSLRELVAELTLADQAEVMNHGED